MTGFKNRADRSNLPYKTRQIWNVLKILAKALMLVLLTICFLDWIING